MSSRQRILIVRTDRIGDVLLSTPAIRAVREAFPDALVTALVLPHAQELLEGSPDLDEVLVLDKRGAQRSWWGLFQFSLVLRRRRFDVALVFHPTCRVHLLMWLAGIPRRVGWAAKWGGLLTDRLREYKREGERHEVDYTLDVVRALGVQAEPGPLHLPVREDDRQNVLNRLQAHGVVDRPLVALHPWASCPSKRWSLERFAEVAGELLDSGHTIVLVGSDEAAEATARVCETLGHRKDVLDWSGQTTVRELGALFERCRVLISNDSGPVHVAVAVGTPVVDLFGRNQQGLSPKRWGPWDAQSRVLHKDVGCDVCLAHRCQINFECLHAIESAEVLAAAREVVA